MIEVISKQAEQSRINTESMVSFDGVSQYAEGDHNFNISQTIDFDKDWSISFFTIVRANTTNAPGKRGYLFGIYDRHATFGSNGFGVFADEILGGWQLGAILASRTAPFINARSFDSNYALKYNNLYHIVINFQASGQLFLVQVNSVNIPISYSTFAQPSSTIWTNLWELHIGAELNLHPIYNYWLNCNLSHITFFNRTLTPQEIQYIHAQGGLLPASSHAACVAHYPCTQREGNTLFDVVEQYNYAKATALVPYHATLQNFTPEQHTGANQSAYKGFYDKLDKRPYLQKFNGVDQYGQFPSNNFDPYGSIDFSISFWFNPNETPSGSSVTILANRIGDSGYGILFNQSSNLTFLLDHPGGGNDNPSFNYSLQLGQIYFISVVQVANTEVRMYVNGKRTATAILPTMVKESVDWSIGTDIHYGSGKYFDGSIGDICFFNKALTDQEAAELYARSGNPQASLYENVVAHYVADSANLQMTDLVERYNYAKATPLTAYHAALQNFSASEDRLIEKNTLLPPLRKALRFDGVDDYLTYPTNNLTNEKGYTIMFTFLLPIERDFQDNPFPDRFVNTRKSSNDQIFFLVRGKPQKKIGIIYTNSTGSNIQSIDSPEIQEISKLSFICLTLGNNQVKIYHNGRLIHSQTVAFIPSLSNHYGSDVFYPADGFHFGNPNFRNLNCVTTKLGIAKGVATPKQIKQLWNNGLLAQPRKEWRNLDWQLLLNFNQIIDNGGNYELENFGSAGGNAVLSGYDEVDTIQQIKPIIEIRDSYVPGKDDITVDINPQESGSVDIATGTEVSAINNLADNTDQLTPSATNYLTIARDSKDRVYLQGDGNQDVYNSSTFMFPAAALPADDNAAAFTVLWVFSVPSFPVNNEFFAQDRSSNDRLWFIVDESPKRMGSFHRNSVRIRSELSDHIQENEVYVAMFGANAGSNDTFAKYNGKDMSNTDLFISTQAISGNYQISAFNGKLFELKYWNRRLTDEEVEKYMSYQMRKYQAYD